MMGWILENLAAAWDLREQAFVFGLVLLVFAAFLRDWFSPDIIAMGAFVVLLVFGVLDKDDALAVFGTGAPLIVACMFVVSAALERTGTIEAMGHWFERVAGRDPVRILATLFVLVIPLSALVNNTPVVVVLMPIVLRLCRKHNLGASHFLIPLSYAAIVGGTCTIIGTSTNVLAAETAEAYGRKHGIPALEVPFGMFEITPLGLVFVATTVTYLFTFGRRLLPDRNTLAALLDSEGGREYLTEATVAEGSPLAGRRFGETPLQKMRELRLVDVKRRGRRLDGPRSEIVFEVGDILTFKSHVSGVMGLNEMKGLLLGPRQALGLEDLRTESAVIMEGVVGPRSRLVGHNLRSLGLRERYGVLVLAVHRRGENLRERFQDVRLAFGDTLLVEGPVEAMNRLFAERDFVNLSRPRHRPFRRSKAPFAIGALLLFMVLGAFKVLPLLVLALLAAVLVVATRCIDVNEAYEAIEWKVIFMIVGMLALGMALEKSGVAQGIAVGATRLCGGMGPAVAVSVVYLLAALLTEMISNNAVAALLTPVAIQIGLAFDVDPRAFVVAVMFGASASFSTPVGYQTNTFVYGAGGYRFADFTRVGLPLALILWVLASLLIPFWWLP